MIKTPLSTVIGGAFWTPGCTVVGGASKTLDQIIKSLFSNNEQGFAYDPNDLTTMYQDAAGAVPVTALGQPVGLIRDKSGRGNHASQTTSAARPLFRQKPILGSELVVNGDFSNGTTGWYSGEKASLSVTNGVLRVTNAAVSAGYGYAWASFPTTAGKKYYVTARRIAGSVNKTSNIHIGTSSASNQIYNILSNADANKPFTFTATTATTYIGLNAQDNALSGWMEYDDISVKEFLGYRTDQNYIEYDKVDDKLITNLPAQLTGCTVIRSVPGVGVQLLTNQTIPATYEDNTDHCGLIVINRALTPSETSAIAAEFNKRAGV